MLKINLIRLSRVLTPILRFKQPEKFLHTTTRCLVKKYQNVENDFAYNFVKKHAIVQEKCDSSVSEFKLEENYANKTVTEFLDCFEHLSHYCSNTECCISNDKFDNFVKDFIKIIPQLNDDEIIRVLSDLSRFPATPNAHSKNFYNLWSELDVVCDNRIKLWKFPELLRVAQLWYTLGLCRTGEYTWNAIRKISRRFHKLTGKQLVETMFYLNLCRKSLQMFDIEAKFLEVLDELDINEIGIVSIAFFKTESKIRNFKLVENLFHKTIEHANDIEDITLVNILKTLRYSSEPLHARLMGTLSETLLPNLHKFSLLACLHIALLGTNLQYCHHPTIEAIIHKFNDNIKNARLKDMERVAFVLGLYDFKSKSGIEKEFLGKIQEELKLRVDEIMKHPKCLGSTAYYLSISGTYDEEVISSVLNEDFINLAYSKNQFKIGREVLCLDSFTKINLKNTYKGNQLKDKMRKSITKFQSHYVPTRNQKYKLTHGDQLLLDVKESMEKKWGENVLTHILPHYQRPDIIYCFNGDHKSVTPKLLDCFPPNYQGEILSKEYLLSQKEEFADLKKHQLIAVVVGGWNFFIRDTNIPTGVLRMKIEQLELIGYKTILVCWSDWMGMTASQKENYLEQVVHEALTRT